MFLGFDSLILEQKESHFKMYQLRANIIKL